MELSKEEAKKRLAELHKKKARLQKKLSLHKLRSAVKPRSLCQPQNTSCNNQQPTHFGELRTLGVDNVSHEGSGKPMHDDIQPKQNNGCKGKGAESTDRDECGVAADGDDSMCEIFNEISDDDVAVMMCNLNDVENHAQVKDTHEIQTTPLHPITCLKLPGWSSTDSTPSLVDCTSLPIRDNSADGDSIVVVAAVSATGTITVWASLASEITWMLVYSSALGKGVTAECFRAYAATNQSELGVVKLCIFGCNADDERTLIVYTVSNIRNTLEAESIIATRNSYRINETHQVSHSASCAAPDLPRPATALICNDGSVTVAYCGATCHEVLTCEVSFGATSLSSDSDAVSSVWHHHVTSMCAIAHAPPHLIALMVWDCHQGHAGTTSVLTVNTRTGRAARRVPIPSLPPHSATPPRIHAARAESGLMFTLVTAGVGGLHMLAMNPGTQRVDTCGAYLDHRDCAYSCSEAVPCTCGRYVFSIGRSGSEGDVTSSCYIHDVFTARCVGRIRYRNMTITSLTTAYFTTQQSRTKAPPNVYLFLQTDKRCLHLYRILC